MKLQNDLSIDSPLLQKSAFALMKAVTSPRSSLSWILRGHIARDSVFVNQMCWSTGTLERVPLVKILPGVTTADVVMPRAFDRRPATSITVEEACHLAAIAKSTGARKILEIGTYDGNTALLLAANSAADGQVVTVDLPPDFTDEQRGSLAYTEGQFNLTARDQLARQYKGHPLAGRIKQVFGDSAKLDWSGLGGPFDLIFVDGGHSEAYVESDSRNAMKTLAPKGILVWHDYGMIPEVSKVVDRFAEETPDMKTYVLEGTRLAIGLNQR